MQPSPTDFDRAPIDRLVHDFAAGRHCPTIAWGIVRDGILHAAGAHGDTDERTVYRVASMTKSFSAAATLLLRDEGVLRLDDELGVHAPELGDLRGPTSDGATITVRDLLSMTSGLVSDDAWADRHLDQTDDELDAMVRAGLVFAEPTGAAFEYSNFGYALLGRVVRGACGQPIQDVVTERLLMPLEMKDSTWTRPEHHRWARPLRFVDDAFVDELPPLGDGTVAPMGGIWSTVTDLARWVAWLDDAFPARDDPDDGPLKRSSRREMQSAQCYVGMRSLRGVRSASSYAYGLQLLDEPDHGTVISHSGGFPGYGSNMRWLRGRRLGVVALSNSTYAPMAELNALIMDELADQGLSPPPDRPVPPELHDMGRRLIELLNSWSDAVADELFADNVALDDPYTRRKTEAARFTPLQVDTVTAINSARARLACRDAEGAAVTITFALTTGLPHRIQTYEITK